MAKQPEQKSATQVAEEGMPGWRAVEEMEGPAALDAIGRTFEPPEFKGADFATIQRKFGAKSDSAAKSSVRSSVTKGETKLVRMKSKRNQDHGGEKIAVVSRGKLIGVQG